MSRPRRQPRCPLLLYHRGAARFAIYLAMSLLWLAPALATPPPRPASRPPISTEEEASAVRVDLDYLPEDSPEREPLRRALLRYYAQEATEDLQQEHPDDAFEQFQSALQLFEARELQDPTRPTAAPELIDVAQRISRAFRRYGAHEEVVTALMVLQTLQPAAEEPRRQFTALSAWLSGDPNKPPFWRTGRPPATGAAPNPSIDEPPASLIHDLEQTARVWPAAPVIHELTQLYQAEAQSLSTGLRSPRDLLRRFQGLQGPGGGGTGILPAFKIARLYLRLPRPQEALRLIGTLGKLQQPELVLQKLLQNTGTGPDGVLDWVKLATMLAQTFEDTDIGLAMCRDAAQRGPKLPQAHLCVADMAYQAGRKGLAMRALEHARDLLPDERPLWDKLGLLYLDHLSDLVGDERTEDLEGMLGKIEGFYKLMEQRFPGQQQRMSMSLALAEVGRGYYNAGRIADAIRFLNRSVAIEPNAAALELLGTVQMRRGQGRQALGTLERARAVELAAQRAEPHMKVFFRARIGRLIAEAMDDAKDPGGPEVRKASLKDWGRLLDKGELSARQRAEAELERGKLLYQAGERNQSLRSFAQAIDLVPDDKESKDLGHIFADTISFLVQRGELEEALTAYHRALGRARVVEYLKVYCSLWVNDLARRAGQPEDPLATAYLKSLRGGKWYAQLARWSTGPGGAGPEEVLLKAADTVGKRAEASFYLGMRELGAGHKDRARGLLQKVLDSDMMAFFEYEMAARYLRFSAPTTPAISPQQERKTDELRRERPPGSI